MPTVQELHDKYEKTGFVIAGITDDDPKGALAFTRSQNYSYPSVWDRSGNVGAALGVTSIPFTVFIGKDGRIVGDLTGRFSATDASKRIDAILKGSSQTVRME